MQKRLVAFLQSNMLVLSAWDAHYTVALLILSAKLDALNELEAGKGQAGALEPSELL